MKLRYKDFSFIKMTVSVIETKWFLVNYFNYQKEVTFELIQREQKFLWLKVFSLSILNAHVS